MHRCLHIVRADLLTQTREAFPLLVWIGLFHSLLAYLECITANAPVQPPPSIYLEVCVLEHHTIKGHGIARLLNTAHLQERIALNTQPTQHDNTTRHDTAQHGTEGSNDQQAVQQAAPQERQGSRVNREPRTTSNSCQRTLPAALAAVLYRASVRASAAQHRAGITAQFYPAPWQEAAVMSSSDDDDQQTT